MTVTPIRDAEFPGPVAGLDLSLTSTGIATVIGGGYVELARIQPKGLAGCPRLDHIGGQVWVRCAGARLVVIEGASYNSTGGHEHERGGLWWLVAHNLWLRGVPYLVVPPATLKKYATGKGNAGKDAVLAAAVRRFPDVPVDGNDQADALWLAAIGADLLGHPIARMPDSHRSAIIPLTGRFAAAIGGP